MTGPKCRGLRLERGSQIYQADIPCSKSLHGPKHQGMQASTYERSLEGHLPTRFLCGCCGSNRSTAAGITGPGILGEGTGSAVADACSN